MCSAPSTAPPSGFDIVVGFGGVCAVLLCKWMDEEMTPSRHLGNARRASRRHDMEGVRVHTHHDGHTIKHTNKHHA